MPEVFRWKEAASSEPTLIALGNFDGVHRGHRQILASMKEEADRRGLKPLLVSFDPHPRYFFRPQEGPSLLTSLAEKAELLAAFGLPCLFLRFDADLAAVEPEDFLRHILLERLGMKAFLLGHDHRFGRKARGDFDMARNLLPGSAENLIPLEPFRLGGEIVSSTLIRDKLARLDLEGAAHLLGRPFFYAGEVTEGFRRGRTLGFPTANLGGVDPRKFRVAAGVYGAWVEVEDGEAAGGRTRHRAVVNLGRNPTFGALPENQPPRIEAHLLDFAGDLYGRKMRIYLLFHLRSEIKFPSPEALRDRIALDVAESRKRFEALPSS